MKKIILFLFFEAFLLANSTNHSTKLLKFISKDFRFSGQMIVENKKNYKNIKIFSLAKEIAQIKIGRQICIHDKCLSARAYDKFIFANPPSILLSKQMKIYWQNLQFYRNGGILGAVLECDELLPEIRYKKYERDKTGCKFEQNRVKIVIKYLQ